MKKRGEVRQWQPALMLYYCCKHIKANPKEEDGTKKREKLSFLIRLNEWSTVSEEYRYIYIYITCSKSVLHTVTQRNNWWLLITSCTCDILKNRNSKYDGKAHEWLVTIIKLMLKSLIWSQIFWLLPVTTTSST